MGRPTALSPFVIYRLGAASANAGKPRMAICIRLQMDGTADLFVFGLPADGVPFLNGPNYVVNVSRQQYGGPNQTPVSGTWTQFPDSNTNPQMPGLLAAFGILV